MSGSATDDGRDGVLPPVAADEDDDDNDARSLATIAASEADEDEEVDEGRGTADGVGKTGDDIEVELGGEATRGEEAADDDEEEDDDAEEASPPVAESTGGSTGAETAVGLMKSALPSSMKVRSRRYKPI